MNDIDLGAVRVGGEILFDLRLISDKRYVYSGFGNSLCCADNDLLRSTVSSTDTQLAIQDSTVSNSLLLRCLSSRLS